MLIYDYFRRWLYPAPLLSFPIQGPKDNVEFLVWLGMGISSVGDG